MYLVDLDDTPSYKLTLVEKNEEDEKEELAEVDASKPTPTAPTPTSMDDATANMSESQLSEEAQKILQEARAKLDALASGQMPATGTTGGNRQ